jgi:hypothetical protein
MAVEVVVDRQLEVSNAPKDTAPDALRCDLGEEALDQIEPALTTKPGQVGWLAIDSFGLHSCLLQRHVKPQYGQSSRMTAHFFLLTLSNGLQFRPPLDLEP